MGRKEGGRGTHTWREGDTHVEGVGHTRGGSGTHTWREGDTHVEGVMKVNELFQVMKVYQASWSG